MCLLLRNCEEVQRTAGGTEARAVSQDADFLYLTGVSQQAVATISAPSPCGPARYTLFVPNASLERERWDGASLSCEAAVHVFGANEAYPVSEVAQMHHMRSAVLYRMVELRQMH